MARLDVDLGREALLRALTQANVAFVVIGGAALQSYDQSHRTALPTDPQSPSLWPAYELLLPHVLALATVLDPSSADAVPLVPVLSRVCGCLLRAGSVQRAIDATTLAGEPR